MPSPEKVLMAVVATLLVSSIALLLLSVVLEFPLLRSIGLYAFGCTVFAAFLPLLLLLVMLPIERYRNWRNGKN